MKRRVCETCLYFEPAGFSKNGWCHHPLRRQNSDVRLMVRANELGCRNGWNADLWVPAENGDSTRREHPLDPIGNRAKAEVAPAEQNDLITSIVAARTDNVPVNDGRPAPAEPLKSHLQEDIFVKQTPSLSWKREPVSDQPATALVQDPKAAILRARDQFRQRRKTEGRLADRQLTSPLSPEVASAREAKMVETFDLSELESSQETFDPRFENRQLLRDPGTEPSLDRRPVSPVSLREIERPFPSMTDFPEDRTRFESVPALEADPFDETEIAEAPPVDTWIETRQLDTVTPEPYMVDEFFDEVEAAPYVEAEPYFEDEELSVHHRESVLDRLLRHRRERRHARPIVDQPLHEQPPHSQYSAQHAESERPRSARVEAPSPAAQVATRPQASPHMTETVEVSSHQTTWDSEPVMRHAEPRPATRMRAWPEPDTRTRPVADIDDDFILPPPLPVVEPDTRQQQRSEHRSRTRYDAAPMEMRSPAAIAAVEPPPVDEFGDQPLFAASPASPPFDETFDQPSSAQRAAPPPAHRMERICRTCRDFRPAENGDRGWCNNKWAFSHRRMVDADDLACRNSLGSWWTPKDDVWRRDGDISRHAQQTPRVDEWLFGTSSESNDRRRSGS